MNNDGLRILTPHGELHLTNIVVIGDPEEVGPIDVVRRWSPNFVMTY